MVNESKWRLMREWWRMRANDSESAQMLVNEGK